MMRDLIDGVQNAIPHGRKCRGLSNLVSGQGGLRHTLLMALVLVLILCSSIPRVAAATKDPRKKDAPRKHHMKRIRCDVCKLMSKHLFSHRQDEASTKKGGEDGLIEFVEKSTTAWRTEGEWMTKLHLEKSWKGMLQVKNMRKQGECTEACRTIEYAAQTIMGEHDADVGEALYTKRFGTDENKFETWLCHELTGVCQADGSPREADAKPVEKEYRPYPSFKSRDPSEQNIERVLGEMADQGLRGNMFTREEAMEKYMMEAGMSGYGHDDL
jgi:hypothetical protein